MTASGLPAAAGGSRGAAIVTGAGRGIGREIALALSRAGHPVGLLARTASELAQVAAELHAAGGTAHVVPCDLADRSALLAALSSCEARLGPPAVLVNNAGIAVPSLVVECPDESWDRTLAVNLTAAFVATRAVLPGMLAAGRGRIVNIASISATLGTERLSAYCASKWGLVGFTKAVSEEVKGRGILVAAVLPGSTDTAMLKQSGFAPRMGPEAIAEAVRWLCCDAPQAATGSCLELFG